MELNKVRDIIDVNWPHYDLIFIEDDTIVIENSFENIDCKNDDDCYDHAREIGEEVVAKLSYLEIKDYCCHRGKWAITTLKVKELPISEYNYIFDSSDDSPIDVRSDCHIFKQNINGTHYLIEVNIGKFIKYLPWKKKILHEIVHNVIKSIIRVKIWTA